MSAPTFEERLALFVQANAFVGKGPISVGLVVTEHARNGGLPLDPNQLLTDSGGQVRGLGRATVQAILKRNGIDRQLASEAGRTSRGSIEKMRLYVGFLNSEAQMGPVDLDAVEKYWMAKVGEWFAAKPFKLAQDGAKSLSAAIVDLFDQAYLAQADMPGVQYAGAMLQHLVGAKLECVLGEGAVTHHGFAASDASTNRHGDFVIDNVAIHATTAPTEAVIARCVGNLGQGLRPVLITLPDKPFNTALGLAANASVADRLEIFDVIQYISAFVIERGKFANTTTAQALVELLTRYNSIIDATENDPALRVEW